MRTPKVWFISLGIAGILDCGMAMAHFGLQWEWHQVRATLEVSRPQLTWALFALNFSWAVLLLGIGVLVLYAATLESGGPFLRASMFVIGLFWAIHAAYVELEPMPLPEYLAWLRIPLVAFPMTLVFLHWLALAGTAAQSGVAVRS